MNVRSVSPEGGGVLLPFRGNRDDEQDHRDDDHTVAPPAVVHLTGRRRIEPTVPRRPRWQRIGVVVAAGVCALAGVVAASLTGVLPLSTERPVPRPAVSAPPTTGTDSANGNLPAAYGLCRAFDRAAERGDDVATAQAFRNLAHAAGGASRVSDYCAPFEKLDPGRAR